MTISNETQTGYGLIYNVLTIPLGRLEMPRVACKVGYFQNFTKHYNPNSLQKGVSINPTGQNAVYLTAPVIHLLLKSWLHSGGSGGAEGPPTGFWLALFSMLAAESFGRKGIPSLLAIASILMCIM